MPNMPKPVFINGFEASSEWYARVKKVAEERRTTIGAAIQYLCELALNDGIGQKGSEGPRRG